MMKPLILEKRLASLLDTSMEWLFAAPKGRLRWTIAIAWIAALFLFGVLLWGQFFDNGNFALDFLDWAEVTAPRFAIWQDAARTGTVPLHAADLTALRMVTDRYLSIADTPYSPQYFLLKYMELGMFIYWNTLLVYAIGFLGLLVFFRRYRLGLFAFTTLFFLFNFNGHIVAHLAVGHVNWTGYFLLPWFFLLIFELVEHERVTWRWVLGFSVTLLLILLQGHFHLYLLCLVFLGLIGLFNLRLLKPVALGGIFSVLIALPRLLPPSLVLEGITQEPLGGFASLAHAISSLTLLTDIQTPMQFIPTDLFPLNYWELDHFIGVVGLLLIAVFGIALPIFEGRRGERLKLDRLLFPSAVIAVLSLQEIYFTLIKIIPLPPFTGERVTSRFLILPIMVLTFLAAVELQRIYERNRHPRWVIGLGALLLISLIFELRQHFLYWRVRYLGNLTYLFPKLPFDITSHTVANHPDPIYMGLIWGGLAVALLSLVFLIWKSRARSES